MLFYWYSCIMSQFYWVNGEDCLRLSWSFIDIDVEDDLNNMEFDVTTTGTEFMENMWASGKDHCCDAISEDTLGCVVDFRWLQMR